MALITGLSFSPLGSFRWLERFPSIFQKNIIIKHFEGRMLVEVQIRCYIGKL
jgi:hypothetical protein